MTRGISTPRRGRIALAKTAGRIGSRLTPTVPGTSAVARCSLRCSAGRATSQSSSGICPARTPAAASSSASGPSGCRPLAAAVRKAPRLALSRSSMRSRISASGSAIRVSVFCSTFLLLHGALRGAKLPLQVRRALLDAVELCSGFVGEGVGQAELAHAAAFARLALPELFQLFLCGVSFSKSPNFSFNSR